MSKFFFFSFFILFITLVPLGAMAQETVQFGELQEEGLVETILSGNRDLLVRIAYAWTPFVAAIIIFALALKFMVGGQLSRPIMIIGLGALANALIGSIPIIFTVYLERPIPEAAEIELLWFGSLVFHLSVILGVMGIAKVFGLLRAK